MEIDDLLYSLKWEADSKKIELLREKKVDAFSLKIGQVFKQVSEEKKNCPNDSKCNVLKWGYCCMGSKEYYLLDYVFNNDRYTVVLIGKGDKYADLAELHINQERQDEEIFEVWVAFFLADEKTLLYEYE